MTYMGHSKRYWIAGLLFGLISSILSAETIDMTRYRDLTDAVKTASVIV